MTPERFQEVFKAAITVGCHGRPPYWWAMSALFYDRMGDDSVKGSGATLSAAIEQLVTLAVEDAKRKLDEARETLKHAEERWRRIEAAAVEMGNPS